MSKVHDEKRFGLCSGTKQFFLLAQFFLFGLLLGLLPATFTISSYLSSFFACLLASLGFLLL